MTLQQFAVLLCTVGLILNIYAIGQFLIGKWSIKANHKYYVLGWWNIAAMSYLIVFFNG